MKKMVTKHGYEWLLPETVGEFQNAGINLDTLCQLAARNVVNKMENRSKFVSERGLSFWGDISAVRIAKSREERERLKAEKKQQRALAKARKLLGKIPDEVRAALASEINKA